MPQVIGTAPLSFKGKDGSLVEGMTIYTSSPLDPAKGGSGCSAEKFFLSKTRLASLDFVPKVGDEVEILFNRFGKVATVRKVSDPLEVVDIEI